MSPPLNHTVLPQVDVDHMITRTVRTLANEDIFTKSNIAQTVFSGSNGLCGRLRFTCVSLSLGLACVTSVCLFASATLSAPSAPLVSCASLEFTDSACLRISVRAAVCSFCSFAISRSAMGRKSAACDSQACARFGCTFTMNMRFPQSTFCVRLSMIEYMESCKEYRLHHHDHQCSS